MAYLKIAISILTYTMAAITSPLDTYMYSKSVSVLAKTLGQIALLASSSSSKSVELAYCKIGTSIYSPWSLYETTPFPCLCVILDQENLCNFTPNHRTSLFVGSHFLFVHMHSTFYRKVGLKYTGVKGGGAHASGFAETSVKYFLFKMLKDVGMELPKNGSIYAANRG